MYSCHDIMSLYGHAGQYSWALHPDTAIQLGGGTSSGGTVSRIAMPVVNASAPISYRAVCSQAADSGSGGVQELEIEMHPTLPSTTLLTLLPVSPAGMCVGGVPVQGGVTVANGVPSGTPESSHASTALGTHVWDFISAVVVTFLMLLQ